MPIILEQPLTESMSNRSAIAACFCQCVRNNNHCQGRDPSFTNTSKVCVIHHVAMCHVKYTAVCDVVYTPDAAEAPCTVEIREESAEKSDAQN